MFKELHPKKSETVNLYPSESIILDYKGFNFARVQADFEISTDAVNRKSIRYLFNGELPKTDQQYTMVIANYHSYKENTLIPLLEARSDLAELIIDQEISQQKLTQAQIDIDEAHQFLADNPNANRFERDAQTLIISNAQDLIESETIINNSIKAEIGELSGLIASFEAVPIINYPTQGWVIEDNNVVEFSKGDLKSGLTIRNVGKIEKVNLNITYYD